MSGKQSLPGSHRIRRSGEYRRTWQEGQRYHTPHFIVIVNSGRDNSRLGITVSRKVGHAVCRNRLKRWIRELFRHNYKRFARACDVSVVAKRQAGRLTHQQMDRELLTVFARLETDHQ